jgi:hypothetical protein
MAGSAIGLDLFGHALDRLLRRALLREDAVPVENSKPGKPASADVGTSGNGGTRFAAVIASPRRLRRVTWRGLEAADHRMHPTDAEGRPISQVYGCDLRTLALWFLDRL